MHTGPSRSAVLAAFGAVYLIWGSTYLAIRIALETMPPFLMASSRFLVAGGLLYAWSRSRGRAPAPTRSEWRVATVVGGLLLLGGNGAVVWAEQFVPSGMVALLVATVPLFMVVLEWLWNGGDAPGAQTLAGLVLGFGGVVLLAGEADAASSGVGLVPVAVTLFAALSWATGSIYARRAPAPSAPRLGTAMQMLAGGALLGLVGLMSGEGGQVAASEFSFRSWAALAYLVFFGSIIGFSAYVWLLRVSTPARVSTYAYVNPAVALFLGWALAGEPMTPRILLGSGVVLGSVIVVTTRRRPSPSRGSVGGAAGSRRPPGARLEADGAGREARRSV